MTTARIVDTSTGLGATKAAVAANADLTVTVTGVGGIPTGAKAVLLSVTGTSSAAGTLTAYQAGTTLPATTSLQMRATENSTTTVLVAASSAGKVSIRNASTGTTQIQVDVLGYIQTGTSTNPGVVTPVTPVRISAAASLAASTTRAVQVTGANGVPTGAGAAIVNVTVTSPAVAGGVKVCASGGTVPTNPQIRFGVSRAITSQVIVPIGSDGKIIVSNTTTGTMTVAVDLIGYVTSGTVVAGETDITLAAPARVADSSTSLAITGPVAAGATVTIPVTGTSGVPVGATGAWVTMTVTSPTAVGSLITWATGTTAPTATQLRFIASQPATIVVYAQLAADGTMKIKNTSTGTIQLAVDVAGYTT